jgi:hypothetical protein
VDKRLTKGELYDISLRITEINTLFDNELPDDIADNLEQELRSILNTLKESIKACKRAHLKVIK